MVLHSEHLHTHPGEFFLNTLLLGSLSRPIKSEFLVMEYGDQEDLYTLHESFIANTENC